MAIPGNLLSPNAESMETDASAWTALVNATGLVRGTGGTDGANCLLFRSVAAGDCQVGLAARVSVTAGTEYWSCSSIFAPAAGAQSRLEIRWYNASGTLISTTQGPVVTASGGVWQQIAAIGTAPAGTVTANVVLRVTATAANQNWFADRVFLGTPARAYGNLLPWNAEGIEIDASGWQAAANCTLTVTTSAYTWFQALRLTSSAAGQCQALTAPVAVTPGVEYVAMAQVMPGTAGLTWSTQIQWLNSSGSVISTSTASTTITTTAWRRCVLAATAPPDAASARMGIAPTATAGGQQWGVDRLVLAPSNALMPAGNLLPYNTSEIEQDTSGWTVTGATVAQSDTQIFSGAYSLAMTATGGDIVAVISTPVPVNSTFGYQFVPCSLQPTERTYRTRIEWLDADGEAIRTRWQSWAGRTNGWLASPMSDLAPDGAVAARLAFIVPDASAGDVWYLDRIEWKEGGLTARAEPAAGGGATITVRGLTTGGPTWKWALWRLVDTGQAPQPVRGWSGDLVAQSVTSDVAVVTDYELPLGVPVQWRVTLTAPAGTLGSFSYTSDPVTLLADETSVWLKDPGLPQRSCKVVVATPMPTWRQEARQGVSQVRGRRLPVVISDVRGGRTGDLTVITETTADREALEWVLSSGNVLLLQWPPGWGETDMYVSVGDISAAPVVPYADFHDRTWTLPLTEVDRPIGGVTGSADRTWQSVKGEGATWAEVLAGATTWLDVYTGA